VVNPSQSALLQALFGIPGYVWSAQFGSFNTANGDTVTYTAPSTGFHDIISLTDATGSVKTLNISLASGAIKDVVDLYAGPDRNINAEEMAQGIDDFFNQQGWLTKQELFLLTEAFLAQ
jgi:hypothetical protein